MHGIPPATYDLDLLSPWDIEQAVLRPYRFERRLSVSDPIDYAQSRALRSTVLTLDTSFVETDPTSQLSLDDVVETTALVRGGRFLIASHEGRWLCCWDLWSNINPPPEPDSPIASEGSEDEEFEVSLDDLPSPHSQSFGSPPNLPPQWQPTCPAIAVFHMEGKIGRVLVQQSTEDENRLILAVLTQSNEQGYVELSFYLCTLNGWLILLTCCLLV